MQGNITNQFNVRSQTDTTTDVTVAYRMNHRTHKRVIMTGKSSLPKDRKVAHGGYYHIKGKREREKKRDETFSF